jgi:hypothetical protein
MPSKIRLRFVCNPPEYRPDPANEFKPCGLCLFFRRRALHFYLASACSITPFSLYNQLYKLFYRCFIPRHLASFCFIGFHSKNIRTSYAKASDVEKKSFVASEMDSKNVAISSVGVWDSFIQKFKIELDKPEII